MIPRNWYTLVELRRGTLDWEEIATRFTHTFDFAYDHPSIDIALQVMKTKIFEERVSQPRRLSALDFAMKATPARWWVAHKQSISEWPQCQRLMEI